MMSVAMYVSIICRLFGYRAIAWPSFTGAMAGVRLSRLIAPAVFASLPSSYRSRSTWPSSKGDRMPTTTPFSVASLIMSISDLPVFL